MKQIKQAFYRFAYRIISRLSDITGGARLFVKWKVALAAVIIGFTATTLTGCEISCYAPAEPTCYDPAPPEQKDPEEKEEEGGEKARYDADDPRFLEDASAEFRDEMPDAAE